MAYTSENFLLRVIEIQAIMLEYKKKGVSQTWVYFNVIRDRYHISQSTFNNYMCMRAKAKLTELKKNRTCK